MNCILLSASVGSRTNLTAGLVVHELQYMLQQQQLEHVKLMDS